MLKRLLLVFLGFALPLAVFSDTLFIDGIKRGQQQAFHFEHVHVFDYGYNSAGDFVVRLMDGREVSYGKPSAWDKFVWRAVADNEQLVK